MYTVGHTHTHSMNLLLTRTPYTRTLECLIFGPTKNILPSHVFTKLKRIPNVSVTQFSPGVSWSVSVGQNKINYNWLNAVISHTIKPVCLGYFWTFNPLKIEIQFPNSKPLRSCFRNHLSLVWHLQYKFFSVVDFKAKHYFFLHNKQ